MDIAPPFWLAAPRCAAPAEPNVADRARQGNPMMREPSARSGESKDPHRGLDPRSKAEQPLEASATTGDAGLFS